MTKTLKFFSLVLLLIFSVAFGGSKVDLEKYRLFVTKVDPESHCFVLSNGMTCCQIIRDWNKKALPNIGIEIALTNLSSPSENKKSNKEEGEFLALDDNGGQYYVWMPLESEQYFLTVVLCRSVCTCPAGWVYSATYENLIELSDGSKWTTSMDHAFARGNRIVVSTDNDFGIWELINLDTVVHAAASSNNETYYEKITASPYLETTKE